MELSPVSASESQGSEVGAGGGEGLWGICPVSLWHVLTSTKLPKLLLASM